MEINKRVSVYEVTGQTQNGRGGKEKHASGATFSLAETREHLDTGEHKGQ